ncbi:MAG: 2-oxo acid dehydrogenase subunit E2 [Oscillospiraceae bacterium]|nr:2-oxo acid dehydrogenase subunit E2 [Oscillospiraceae bacterium]
MGRSDGTRVKNIPAIDKLIPHVMSRRYDATNFCKVEFDMTNLHAFIRKLRAEGHRVGTMDAVIAAFAFVMQKVPEINRFIAGKKIYQRNHLCVSFVILKRSEDGQLDETAVKAYIEPSDTLLTISQKVRELIQENQKPESQNAMDRLVNRLVSAPLLPGFLVGLIKWADRRGILPKSVIALSPFHTSMFLSNLASLQMDHVYHHLYDFGTTSLFVTMGKPSRVSSADDKTKRVMTLGMSLDERICTGAVWAKALFELKRTMENPEVLLGAEGEREE